MILVLKQLEMKLKKRSGPLLLVFYSTENVAKVGFKKTFDFFILKFVS